MVQFGLRIAECSGRCFEKHGGTSNHYMKFILYFWESDRDLAGFDRDERQVDSQGRFLLKSVLENSTIF